MIKFYCQHCGAKISAELSDAGSAANCPSCGQDLVVPTEPITVWGDHQTVENLSSVPKQPEPSFQSNKLPPRKRKKMMLVGIPVILATVIAGGAIVAKQAKTKPSVEKNAENKVEAVRKINTTSIGGRLDDFVEKYGGGDSVAVVATERMNYRYRGFVIGENAVLVVGYDDDEFVTCGVVFRHDGKKKFTAQPLEEKEIENGLNVFSRLEGVDWIESSPVGEDIRIWGYIGTEDSLKWGSSPLMAIYTPEIPFLVVFSTYSDRSSYNKLGVDMRHWQMYARNRSESN